MRCILWHNGIIVSHEVYSELDDNDYERGAIIDREGNRGVLLRVKACAVYGNINAY